MQRAHALAVLLPMLAACGTPRQADLAQLHGYSVPADQAWKSGTIKTCWENGTPATAAWRTMLQQTVETAYAPVTGVHFTGWGKCVAGKGLHLEIYKDGPTAYHRHPDQYDGHPRALGLGGRLDGARPGVVLNPTLTDVQPNLAAMAADFDAEQIANLQAAIVIHELGHVLGLMHEQSRSDSPCRDYPDSNAGGGVDHGAYDPQSIMNYCVTHTNDYKAPLTLSAGDVSTLNSLYH